MNSLRVKNAKHVAAGSKGGNATLSNHGREHFVRMGQTPPRPGSAKRGRPAIDYVIGNDGLLYSGNEAIALAKDSNQDWNPAVNNGV